MKNGNNPAFWSNEKVKRIFLKMCKKCYRPSVNWKKFRDMDTNGIFEDFNNARLSMKFRNAILRDLGLCWYCGVEPVENENGLCPECEEKVKETNKNYYSSLKEPA